MVGLFLVVHPFGMPIAPAWLSSAGLTTPRDLLCFNQGRTKHKVGKRRCMIMPDYSDYVFIYDKEGNEYACPIKNIKGQVVKTDKLTEEEKKKCLNMGEIVGTERI
jgi:hypothetical protein